MNIAPMCQGCRREVPAKYCEFTQGIGMLVLRTSRSVKGNMCKACASKYFWERTGLTLVTGWWGLISFVMNIVYIISNVSYFISSRSLPEPGNAFPVQPGGSIQSGGAAGNSGGPPSLPPANLPSPGGPPRAGAHPMVAHRQDIVLRLRGGQTPQQIAEYLAPRTGFSVAQSQQYVQAVQQGRA